MIMKLIEFPIIEMKTNSMKAIFKSDPDEFVVALRNMFALGDIFAEMNSPITGEQLQQIYDALSQIESVIKSLK